MSTIITGHQPVYLPWLGLFHKISLADTFIFMDDVQYLTGDWNNRNKIKTPHDWMYLTVPVSVKKSRSLLLKDIRIDNSKKGTKNDWQVEHWKAIIANYKRAPYFSKYSDFFYDMYIDRKWERLVDINEYQLRYFLEVFDLYAKLYKASELNFTNKKSDLVLEHCLRFNSDICVVGCHGKDYIKERDFNERGIRVYYQNYLHPQYEQLWGDFIPYMSIIDLLFNHGNASLGVVASHNIIRRDLT